MSIFLIIVAIYVAGVILTAFIGGIVDWDDDDVGACLLWPAFWTFFALFALCLGAYNIGQKIWK